MSHRLRILLGLAAAILPGLLVLPISGAAAQQPTVDFNVSGTSTVRGWTCSAKGVVAVMPGGGAPLPGFPSGVQAATVTVPLKSFTCPNDEMREHLLEAMKAEAFPEIVYRVERYDIAGSQAQTTGSMTIVGVTQPVSFPITFKASEQGVQIEGNTRVEFAKFGLDPPVVMLGLMKVGPQVRVEFKGVVAP